MSPWIVSPKFDVYKYIFKKTKMDQRASGPALKRTLAQFDPLCPKPKDNKLIRPDQIICDSHK